jgi:hypothetical protein
LENLAEKYVRREGEAQQLAGWLTGDMFMVSFP